MPPQDAHGAVEPLAASAEEVTARAEHARLNGPAPDCAARMEASQGKHRVRIAAARLGEDRAEIVSDRAGRWDRPVAITDPAATRSRSSTPSWKVVASQRG